MKLYVLILLIINTNLICTKNNNYSSQLNLNKYQILGSLPLFYIIP